MYIILFYMLSYDMSLSKVMCTSQAEGGKVYEALHRAAHQIAELRAEHRSVHSPLKRNVKELSLIAARRAIQCSLRFRIVF